MPQLIRPLSPGHQKVLKIPSSIIKSDVPAIRHVKVRKKELPVILEILISEIIEKVSLQEYSLGIKGE